MNKQFNHVAIGGTFDHLHDGHKALIDKAFEVGEYVSIGITSDAFVKNKNLAPVIESHAVRKKALEQYLSKKGYLSRTGFIKLNDIYGSAIEKNNIEALVVSRETLVNAKKINRERRRQKLPQLKIVLVELVKGETKKIIRSERIRYGEMDRHGSLFINLVIKKSKLYASDVVRNQLRIPLGIVIAGSEEESEHIAYKIKQKILEDRPTLIITVGDFITASLLSISVIPNVQIIDFKTRRLKNTSVIIPVGKKVFSARNSAGTVSKTVSQAIKKAISVFFKTKKPQHIVVKGEEDLTALSAILLSPLNSMVIYGQHGMGAVVVTVDEEVKEKARKMLAKFH